MEQFYVNKHFPRKRIRPSTVSGWTRCTQAIKGTRIWNKASLPRISCFKWIPNVTWRFRNQVRCSNKEHYKKCPVQTETSLNTGALFECFCVFQSKPDVNIFNVMSVKFFVIIVQFYIARKWTCCVEFVWFLLFTYSYNQDSKVLLTPPKVRTKKTLRDRSLWSVSRKLFYFRSYIVTNNIRRKWEVSI